jgi:hypothetical protein
MSLLDHPIIESTIYSTSGSGICLMIFNKQAFESQFILSSHSDYGPQKSVLKLGFSSLFLLYQSSPQGSKLRMEQGGEVWMR